MVKHEFRTIVPDLERNLEQARDAGLDLQSDAHPELLIEVKHGKKYNSKMIQHILDQVDNARGPQDFAFAVVRPHRETPYALVPMDVMKSLVQEHIEWKRLIDGEAR